MVFRFSILFSFIYSFSCFAQNGTIEGRVMDAKGNVIVGASVIYKKDITIGAVSDDQGNYTLSLPAGNIKLLCKYSGMKSDTSNHLLIAGQVIKHNITLEPYVLEFEQVKVSVGKFDKPLEEQTVTMVVLKPELIENKNTRIGQNNIKKDSK